MADIDYDTIVDELIKINNKRIHPNPADGEPNLTQFELMAIHLNQIVTNKLIQANQSGKVPSQFEFQFIVQVPVNLDTVQQSEQFIYPNIITKKDTIRQMLKVKIGPAKGFDGKEIKPKSYVLIKRITANEIMQISKALLKRLAENRAEGALQYRKFLRVAKEQKKYIKFATILKGVLASSPFPGPADPGTPPCALLTNIPE